MHTAMKVNLEPDPRFLHQGTCTIVVRGLRQSLELQAGLERPNDGLLKRVLRVSELKSAAVLYKT